ncbi:hypothetical protein BI364_02670 [Acidihalobacter yilgarnensis]|uniref:Spore protein YkvP/CgeB glycosyl transferase-like domain-containing protein n=1 Tax=Acidihalobacter yilgarnensis TaxID=2819280 RepID=A0A1D8IKR3_9GAMM|nr:glycosyltransferase [Acidihalobacter yilgarnensis]AOU97052.1 hypothetical protein BI364_02670 [Acidihalobacter yilgarnensis]
MRILLVTDLYRGSDHSAVEAIFGRHLAEHMEVDRVYFDREIVQPVREDTMITLPHACRRHGLTTALSGLAELKHYDWIVVRNLFPALSAILRVRGAHGPRIAFWDSFPHAYRRYHQSRVIGRARLRKTLEYRWRARSEARFLARCDAYLPITDTHRRLFHPTLAIPSHPLPLGFDFASTDIPVRPPRNGPLRFAYAGTIDRLRRMDTVLAGFAEAEGDYELHLYTPLDAPGRDALRLPHDPRFHYHPPVPRKELLQRLAEADVGLGLIPPERLYLGSSPTKTFEYYAAGLPALLSELPDYHDVFERNCALYCDFTPAGIAGGVARAQILGREALQRMGAQGCEAVRAQRDYAHLGDELLQFLAGLA